MKVLPYLYVDILCAVLQAFKSGSALRSRSSANLGWLMLGKPTSADCHAKPAMSADQTVSLQCPFKTALPCPHLLLSLQTASQLRQLNMIDKSPIIRPMLYKIHLTNIF